MEDEIIFNIDVMLAKRKIAVRLFLRRAVRASVSTVPSAMVRMLRPNAASRLRRISRLNSI